MQDGEKVLTLIEAKSGGGVYWKVVNSVNPTNHFHHPQRLDPETELNTSGNKWARTSI